MPVNWDRPIYTIIKYLTSPQIFDCVSSLGILSGGVSFETSECDGKEARGSTPDTQR